LFGCFFLGVALAGADLSDLFFFLGDALAALALAALLRFFSAFNGAGSKNIALLGGP
jgi:hypothetical protein